MLYSPNWTYALIFFFGISLEKFADKKWIQIGLLIFLIALLFNNIELFRKILNAIQPFFG
jgi:Na+/phosphate symporter